MNFSTKTDIAVPRERVWAVMIDVERWPEWTPSVTWVRRLDGGELRLGSLVKIRQPKFPAVVWKVTEVKLNQSFTWTTGGPGMLVTAKHAVESIKTGSRVTLTMNYAGLIGRLIARMTSGIIRHYMDYEANGLKQRSEKSRAQATGRSA